MHITHVHQDLQNEMDANQPRSFKYPFREFSKPRLLEDASRSMVYVHITCLVG